MRCIHYAFVSFSLQIQYVSPNLKLILSLSFAKKSNFIPSFVFGKVITFLDEFSLSNLVSLGDYSIELPTVNFCIGKIYLLRPTSSFTAVFAAISAIWTILTWWNTIWRKEDPFLPVITTFSSSKET